ncbi:MAG: fumarylacetoacetate hydrolase superfamily protein [Pseudonocardiales bacterium]|nr:fumarylacetoacetate hydrolase superfamily protein [Pseudonocardiales bacterium]
MRLMTFRVDGDLHAGLLDGDHVIDLSSAVTGLPADQGHAGPSVKTLVALGADARDAIATRARERFSEDPEGTSRPLSSVVLEAPITDPDKIICLGLNYQEHAEEFGEARPVAPILFAKFRNALCGAGGAIVLPRDSVEIDYEGELAVVIGRECRDVSQEEAIDCIAGVMPFNDVTARDLQFLTGQWLPGKMIDGFAPCGPFLVTLDEIGDLQDLTITTRLNGEVMQQESTSKMIFSVAQTIAYLSNLVTLTPGDIVATGTPSGVGFKREPPRYLLSGDTIEVDISTVGTLANSVRGAMRADPVVSTP